LNEGMLSCILMAAARPASAWRWSGRCWNSRTRHTRSPYPGAGRPSVQRSGRGRCWT